MTNDTVSQIVDALGIFATRPAGWGYLGNGSGQIVADVTNRLVYYRVAKGQPAVTAKLVQQINILAINRTECDGMRVDLGYPPSQTVLHVLKVDDGEGMASLGGLTLEEQYNASAKYHDVGSILNFRLSPNDPVDSEVYINAGSYKDASGNPAWWGGDSTATLLTAAIAALASGEHQMAVVYINNTTGLPAIITNTAEAGGVNDKQVFDITTIVEMTYAGGEVLVGAVHLYEGQTTITEDDIYRSSDPRIVFDATGAGGGAPDDAKYILQQADGDLPNAQAMGALGTGLVKNTTGTGVQSIAVAGTDYTTPTGTENLSNKTITASSLIATALSLLIGGFRAIFTHAFTADRTVTLPGDANVTLVGESTTQNVSNKTINISSIGVTTAAAGYFSALRLLIGGFYGIFTHANTADRTYTLPNYNATLSPSTTKGDFSVFNGTDNTRQPVGADGKYVVADSTTATGLAYADGALDTTGATGESWAANDDLYLDAASNTWFKIDIDAVPAKISDVRGVALTAATHPASGKRIRKAGIVPGYTGLTPGAALYASSTAGGYTQTRPSVSSGSGQVIIWEFGYAIDATSAFIDARKPVEYIIRGAVANGTSLAIVHQSDPTGRGRTADAYLTSNTEVTTQTYASSNRDADAPLRRRSTGSTVTVDAAGANTTALGDTGGTDFRLAQQFEVTTTGYASTIAISTGATTGAPSVFPSYRIETNNATTIPSGSTVTNSSGTLGAWTASGTTTITYAAPGPYLTAGVKYWFILELSAMQANNNFYTVLRNTAGAYTPGVLKTDSTTGASFPDTWSGAGGGGTNDMRVAITTVVVNDALTQMWTNGGSQVDITKADLWLKRTGTLSGNASVELWIDDGTGNPLALVSTSNTVLSSTIGTSYAYVTFTFNIPVGTLPSTGYHIVLKTTDLSSATAYMDWGIDTSSPGFSGGVFHTLRNTTWADFSPAADGCFILYAVGTYYDVPLSVGPLVSGTPYVTANYGDTSYANQDTKTTFTNTSGGYVDFTGRVRMD